MPTDIPTGEQLVEILQNYLTVLQHHPSAEEMMENVLTGEFQTAFVGGQVWKGLDGLRDGERKREIRPVVGRWLESARCCAVDQSFGSSPPPD